MSEFLVYLYKKDRLDISNRLYFCVSKAFKKAEKQYFKEVLNDAHLCWFDIISSTRVASPIYEWQYSILAHDPHKLIVQIYFSLIGACIII